LPFCIVTLRCTSTRFVVEQRPLTLPVWVGVAVSPGVGRPVVLSGTRRDDRRQADVSMSRLSFFSSKKTWGT
jgi:hypothetical protein